MARTLLQRLFRVLLRRVGVASGVLRTSHPVRGAGILLDRLGLLPRRERDLRLTSAERHFAQRDLHVDIVRALRSDPLQSVARARQLSLFRGLCGASQLQVLDIGVILQLRELDLGASIHLGLIAKA